MHLEDVLMQRTRLHHEQADGGCAALEEIADLVGPVLGWDKARREAEIGAYRARVAAENAAATEFDDASAEAVRLAVGDLTPMHTPAGPAAQADTT